MKEPRQLLCCLLLLVASFDVLADGIVVIVNRENTVQSLELEQVVDLYMGRLQTFPDGSSALPMDQPPASDARTFFYRKLVDKSVAEVNAYWARLLFTGRASPPRVMPDDLAVLKTVRDNRDAIGYLAADKVDDSVKIVFRIE